MIIALEQNRSHRRLAILRYRRDRDCVHLIDSHFHRSIEPNPELTNRVGIEIDPAQTVGKIFFAQSGEIVWQIHGSRN